MKQKIIIGIFIATLVVVTAMAYLYPIKTEIKVADNIPFQTIDKGTYSNIDNNQFLVIKDSGDLNSTWEGLDGEFPEIDFEEYILIAVFQGQKPSGGYSIEIAVIEEFSDFIQVGVVEKSPGDGCAVTEALTSPYHIVQIEQTEKPIRFSHTRQVIEC